MGRVKRLCSEGFKQWGEQLLSEQARSNGNAADCGLVGQRFDSRRSAVRFPAGRLLLATYQVKQLADGVRTADLRI